ncbi:hypothetical protein [Neisseria yangbaofengii]|uniref:hypothetical protein n=2 Tax=Neisseria yangbaofengii TaxID=2709396 RepID=UPI0013EA5DC3|nr:hypothetical protein [Neisseria yangbaofengii]
MKCSTAPSAASLCPPSACAAAFPLPVKFLTRRGHGNRPRNNRSTSKETRMDIRTLLAISTAALLWQPISAATVTETYDDPERGQVVRTTTTVDEPGFKSRTVTEQSSSVQQLTPQQQAEFAEAMTQWAGSVLQNGLHSGKLLSGPAKINGIPFDDAFQKQANEAAAFLKSGEGQAVMKKNLGAMMNILPQLEAASQQMMQQMEQHNRALQQQLDSLFQE